MKILYVYPDDWPRNATRPDKQTRALAEAGHSVCLLVCNSRGEPRFGAESWMEIERIPRLGSAKLNRYLGFPVFANPFWLLWIIRAAMRVRPDVLIVSDLPLAPAGIVIAKLLGIPVHYDMADVYPVAMRSNPADHPGLIARFTRNPAIAEWLDRWSIRNSASVFVVSEESRQRCIQLGGAPNAVALVGNTPSVVPDLDTPIPIPADIADWAGRPFALFIGNLLADRGLVEAIDAIAEARKLIPEVALVIIGDGREYANLATYIKARGVETNVRLLGWKAPADHPAYYKYAAIGILPFHSTEHINITLANKLFDYMSGALAVIGSDGPPMRRVLTEAGAGVLVPPSDVPALANAIVSLVRDPEQRRTFGARGRAAVTDGPYAWAKDRGRFLAAIERLNGRPS